MKGKRRNLFFRSNQAHAIIQIIMCVSNPHVMAFYVDVASTCLPKTTHRELKDIMVVMTERINRGTKNVNEIYTVLLLLVKK